MGKRASDFFQGTLDMLILSACSAEPRHGYGIMRWIRRVSEDGLQLEEGALYPALHRLEARGWLRSSWGRSDRGRQARFYELTPEGGHQLAVERKTWRGYVEVVARVLAAAEG